MSGEKQGETPKPGSGPQPAAPPKTLGVRITSPSIADDKRLSPGAPIKLNDDHDNGQFVPSTTGSLAVGAPRLRELEPILDLHFLGDSPAEDDLLEIKLDLTPPGQKGTVQLDIPSSSGKDRVRLWPKKTKGNASDVITLPLTVAPKDLPKTFFVEGIQTGIAQFEATFTPTGKAASSPDRLTVNVVRLQVNQLRNQKMVYLSSAEVFFRVLGASATEAPNYTFEWDLDGDGTFEITTPQNPSSPNVAKVTYAPPQLLANATNTRKTFDPKVRLNGTFELRVTDGVTASGAGHRSPGRSGIRVALNSHQGQALPPKTDAGLQALFQWSDVFPVKFDPSSQFSGAGRIKFDATLTGEEAETNFFGTPGAGRRVNGVIVGPIIFNTGQVREDLLASVNHEIRHLKQHVAVRDNAPPNNIWRLLDDHFHGINGYAPFREAEGHFSEILDTNVSWRHLTPEGQNDIKAFVQEWERCLTILQNLPAGPVKTEARKFLQEIYKDVPFFEMKRQRDVIAPLHEYTDSIRAPE